MSLSVVAYLLTCILLECSGARPRIVVPPYAGIAQNGGNVVPIPPGPTGGNGDYQCVPSGTCPGGAGDDEIDIRIVTPVSERFLVGGGL